PCESTPRRSAAANTSAAWAASAGGTPKCSNTRAANSRNRSTGKYLTPSSVIGFPGSRSQGPQSLHRGAEGAGDEVAVELRDVLDRDFLRARGLALVDVGAVPEPLAVVRRHHRPHPLLPLRLPLRQLRQVAHLRGEEEHRRGVRARRDARPA